MSRMKQLQALAKEAREKGDRDKYEMIRGDIFKEFDFDIGKFGLGGFLLKKGKNLLEKTGVIDDLPAMYRKMRDAKDKGDFKKFKKYKSKATEVVKDSKSMKQFQKELDEDLPLPKNYKPIKKKPEGKVIKIKKKQGGGDIKYDKGSQMDQYLKGLKKARAKVKSDLATIRAGKKNMQNTIDKGMADLNKKYENLYKNMKKAPLPPKIKAAKRVGNIALGLGTAAFAGAGYEIKKMFDRNMQLGARSKYGSSQDYPERPDTDKFGRKINKKNIGGEVRGMGKAIRGFKFGGIK